MVKFGWNNVGEHIAAAAGTTAAAMARSYFRPLNAQQRRDAAAFSRRRANPLRRPAGKAQTYVRRKKPTTRGGVLGGTNADMRNIYRKKRMPRRMRKRWASFVRKVNAVDERDLGTRTVLYNDTITQEGTGGQCTLTLALYSFKNASNGWLDDLNQIGQLENEGNPTADLGATIGINSKVLFQSAVMDVTLRNTSTFWDAGLGKVLDSRAALELDIYEVYIRKEVGDIDGDTNFRSLSSMLSRYDDPDLGGGTATGIAIQDRGASPFEFGSQMARMGIKIISKKKFFIPNGQTITWQLRDPKRHVCRYGELEKNDGWVRPGWTKTFFLIYKLVPGLTPGGAQNTYQPSVTLGVTRKYAYKVEGFNEPREKLINGAYTPTANN